jgi:hypothetical protein
LLEVSLRSVVVFRFEDIQLALDHHERVLCGTRHARRTDTEKKDIILSIGPVPLLKGSTAHNDALYGYSPISAIAIAHGCLKQKQ